MSLPYRKLANSFPPYLGFYSLNLGSQDTTILPLPISLPPELFQPHWYSSVPRSSSPSVCQPPRGPLYTLCPLLGILPLSFVYLSSLTLSTLSSVLTSSEQPFLVTLKLGHRHSLSSLSEHPVCVLYSICDNWRLLYLLSCFCSLFHENVSSGWAGESCLSGSPLYHQPLTYPVPGT